MRATVFSGIFLLLSATALPQTQTQTRVPSGRAVLEAYVSAWNRQDFAALDKILAPDAVHEDIALGAYARGIAQIKGFMQKVIQGQPDLEWRVSRFVESGPITVAEWTWTSTFTGESPRGPVEKQRVFGRGVSVVLTEKGQIKHLTDYYDLPSFSRKAPAMATKRGTTLLIPTPRRKRETWGTGHTEWKYPDAIVMRQRNAGVLRLRSG
jgi:steroid delta-isomerase-like uncharacterized protein